jgi:putative FmdB family regulatory protein
MPIYEYHCSHCGTFETMQRITEPPLKRCPTCKGKVERMVSRTSFILKGNGWYATDYARSSSKGSGAAGEGSSAGDSSKSEGSKSESSKTESSSSTSSDKGGSAKAAPEKSTASK